VSKYSLGIDIGGTFTDIVVYDHEAGRHLARKELTTHDDPSRGVMTGVAHLIAEDGVPAAAIGRVVHATTLFTNAVIERKGAVTGLVTTAGFRDTLEIGRERKYDLYDIAITKPAPLIPRYLRAEVAERMRHDGRIETPLDLDALETAVATLRAEGAESIAVLFLHSYANPAHEREAAAFIEARHPDLAVSASVDVAPEVREYERASTTAANAFIKPLASRYLDSLAQELEGQGVAASLLLMLSSGGLAGIEEAKRSPVQLLESGPAAGALAAAHLGAGDGGDNLLAFDMGGTTAKLSVVDEGRPLIAYGFEAARERRFVEGSGLPIRISTIELIEIGAGGGSIAHIDDIGLMKVGPESAGSEPGPAAYGQGGTAPTVTDADFLLGYLNPDFFAGGGMAVDMDTAAGAMAPLVEATGLTPEKVAWGLYDIVNENMASAARVHIAERGRDPRRYTLFATGGAGPVHAYYVAAKLGIGRIVCPPAAGVASALGLLLAPAKVDRMATLAVRLDAVDWAGLEAAYGALETEAREVIAETGLDGAAAKVERLADMRCVGQAFEIVVPLPAGPYATGAAEGFVAAFEESYLEKFTRTPPPVPVEIVNIRSSLSAEVPESELGRRLVAGGGGEALKGHRPVYFPEFDGRAETPVYDRYALGIGDAFEGPAIVEERESTLVVGPGGRFDVRDSGNIVVTLPEDNL
jgi:N-methylhydantoinase A